MFDHDAPDLNSDEQLDQLMETEMQKAMQMKPSDGSAGFFADDGTEIPVSGEAKPVASVAPQVPLKRKIVRRGAPRPVTIELQFPLEFYENDKLVREISSITLTRPYGRTIIEAQAEDTNVLAAVCGLSAEEFDALDGEDFMTITEKAVPFLPARLIQQAQEARTPEDQ